MRIVLSFLIALTLALPAQAQAQDSLFATFEREVEAVPDVVVHEAMSLAMENDYLRAIPPMALVSGDVHLRFEDASFVLYLHPTNHHTHVRLESRSLDISDAAQREAEAFLQEVAKRSASKG